MRHEHTRATAVPADLVEAQARANSKCEKVWREAKSTANFALVRPHLTEVVNLVRQQASALAPALGLSPYDALMDGYQRGIGASDVASIFGAYEQFLMEALPRAEERQQQQQPPVKPTGPFPVAAQETLVQANRGADRARLRPCAARSLGAPVFRWHANRREDHDAVRPGGLHPGDHGGNP